MKVSTKIRLLNSFGVYNIARSLYYQLEIRNPTLLNFYSSFIKKDSLCFDVGANIGRKTDVFLKLGARVVVIEPHPECLNFLRFKYRFNKNVIIINKALNCKNGRQEMYICESNALSSLSEEWIQRSKKSERAASFTWNKSITVETTTLDELIKIYGQPQFCKIDVEGYEINVLKGLSQPLPMLSLELAPEGMKMIYECIEYLTKLGSPSYNYTRWEGATEFMLAEWLPPAKMLELLKNKEVGPQYGELYVQFQN